MPEKKKKKFTPEQLERIKKAWQEGRQPRQCIGQCNLGGFLIVECSSCGWTDESYIPN